MRVVWCCLLVAFMAGCVTSTPPAPADPSDAATDRLSVPGNGLQGPSGGPPVETTVHHAGKILLRPASGGGPTYVASGDPAGFCFRLPTNVTMLRGVFTFSPWQQAGLEFRNGPAKQYAGSWNETPTTLFAASPIEVDVLDPAAGTWFTYGGPGIIGGDMDWTMDLTMVTNGVPNDDIIAAFNETDTHSVC